MRFQIFSGPDLATVFRAARAALGDDVAVVDTQTVGTGRGREIRVVAVRQAQVDRLRERLEPGALAGAGSAGAAQRPVVVALVGPTGAGKTTTLAKLALSARAFGGKRVGLLTLDTYRVGALEQVHTYAEVADLPLEVVYHAREAQDALGRLADRDIVLIDTPGRGPRSADRDGDWRDAFGALAPAETHLVLPASLRPDIAESICAAYAPLGVSHLLLTKLDEVPGEIGVTELADRLDHPARWVTDGQEVPTDLAPAVPRLLAALGRTWAPAAAAAA